MENVTYLGGKAELAIGELVIEPQFLGDMTVTFQEGTRTSTSLAGTINRPSGQIETAQIEGNFILPSMDALKILYGEMYEAPTGEGADLSGRIRIGGADCTTPVTKPINIHYSCDANSDNDFHVFAGLVQLNLSLAYNSGDNLITPFTIMAQPTSDGYAIAGAGDLTKKTLWDATTQTWVDVPVSA